MNAGKGWCLSVLMKKDTPAIVVSVNCGIGAIKGIGGTLVHRRGYECKGECLQFS